MLQVTQLFQAMNAREYRLMQTEYNKWFMRTLKYHANLYRDLNRTLAYRIACEVISYV